jgi:succinate dehydrogenase / fumarate reductase flavoprotein subunit
MDSGRVVGCFAYWRETGKFIVFKARAVVMATGGIGKMFRVTSNSWEYTAEGGLLKNSKGERFMERYDPKRMELSTRDQVAKAIYTEVKEGRGTEHGGVWLDISHKDAEYIKKKLPSMYHQFKDLADVDITKSPMEIGPTMHYVMGGIRVEPDNGAATVPGLYACGECSGGMHGGNRLGGNSLSDLVVFGKRAGEGAAQFAKQNRAGSIDDGQVKRMEEDLMRPFASKATHTPYDVHFELQDMMSDNVGIMRTGEDIKKAIASFPGMMEKLRTSRVEGSRMFNPGWHMWADMANMLLVAEVVARSALQREESRGAHTRLDFPKTDSGGHWESVNSRAIYRNGTVNVDTFSKPQMPAELKTIVEAEGK